MDWTFLLEYGFMGIIVGWFMFRLEKVVKNNTEVLITVKETMRDCKQSRRKR